MAQTENIPRTYPDAVQTLAGSYGDAGADDLAIFSADDSPDNVVRLIHVSETFPDLGNIRVYRFGASAEFPFRSAIALVRPEQWMKIQRGSDVLGLPSDWNVGNARQVWPRLNGPVIP